MVILRTALQSVPEYQPGRQGSAEEAESQGWAQLSSNEMPFGLLPEVRDAIAEALSGVNRYPAMAAGSLRAALAIRHGVMVEEITVGCGAVEVGRQAALATVAPGSEVLFGWPSFPEYRIVTLILGGRPVPVPLVDHTYDLDAMAERVTPNTSLIFICNPNNPTGTIVPLERIRSFVEDLPRKVLVVVDEAYWEFAESSTGASAVSLIGDFPNLVVLRTFSKAFGLAGLRVGYGVGSRETVSAMRKVQLPFSVNELAERAALAALAHMAGVQQRVGQICEARASLVSQLRGIGFELPDSYGNFVWVPESPGVDLVTKCEEVGVIGRRWSEEGGRFTVGTEAENERLVSVARSMRLGSG